MKLRSAWGLGCILLCLAACVPPAQVKRDAANPVVASKADQLRLLTSPQAQLAANKRLVYDMYRVIVQGGHAERVAEFFTEEYIQHNPNVASGRDQLATFLRNSRPARPLEDHIVLPLLDIIAERDRVLVVNQRPETDATGATYLTTWFDLYRIENGRIAEHWDPALKSAAMLKFDPNSTKR